MVDPRFETEEERGGRSSTFGSTIMSDYSENMDFSPTRQAKIAACEKLRDTVTVVSQPFTSHYSMKALHVHQAPGIPSPNSNG
ncbi:hypothetical protein TNIN_262411 [Trichonephila inaurata madagascariensis]|uniref:Uncharacterized protein n=1 Tax=Trichonephila inaurata madagascariensis TaxID=2747483 RepID=A0A8X6WX11_9ARAC|nr:hypothetical protein TNIN_328231 [Trichonephila inaurata madagascariensis]GFY47806.1 hypothetical protein TNIN_262411 [Trichonephila inaurata madagascariensis]